MPDLFRVAAKLLKRGGTAPVVSVEATTLASLVLAFAQ